MYLLKWSFKANFDGFMKLAIAKLHKYNFHFPSTIYEMINTKILFHCIVVVCIIFICRSACIRFKFNEDDVVKSTKLFVYEYVTDGSYSRSFISYKINYHL